MDKLFIYAVSVLSFLLMPFCVEIHAAARSGLGFSVSSCSDTSVQTQPPPAAFEVSGVVLDSASRIPVAGAAVIFGNTGTGGLTYSVTGSDGKFKVSVAAGDYSITVTHVQYYDFTYKTGIASVTELSPFALKENVESLEAASVTGSYIKRRGSNYTVSVKGNPKAEGLSTLSFMGTLPGVRGLSVNDRPAVIYINDRELKMSRDQIVQYLSTVPTESIEDIRVRPSKGAVGQASRRSAAIYIRTRRNESEFISAMAMINPEYKYGVKGAKGDLSGSFGYFDKKISSLTFFYGGGFFENEGRANIVDGNEEASDARHEIASFTLDQSFVYDISDKHSIGLGLNVFYKPYELWRKDYTGGSRDYRNNSIVRYHKEEVFVQYAYKFGRRNSSFKLTADLVNGNTNVSDEYINAPEGFVPVPLMRNGVNAGIQADLSLELDDDMNLTIGTNYTGMVASTAYPDGMELSGGEKLYNVPYREGIYSAYAEYYASFWDGRLDLTAGLRYEHAFSKARPSGDSWNTYRYDDFFPYVDLTYNFKKDGYYLSLMFDRTIFRPSSGDYIPYVGRDGEQVYDVSGLSLVLPEYRNELSLTQTIGGAHTVGFSYSFNQNVYNPVYFTQDDKIVSTWTSAGSEHGFSLFADMGFWIIKYTMHIGLNLKGQYNMLENIAGDSFNSWEGRVSARLWFQLSKSWTMALTGSYNSPSKSFSKIYDDNWSAGIAAGTDLGKNWHLTLYLYDVLNNRKSRSRSIMPGLPYESIYMYDSARAGFTLTYKFSNYRGKRASRINTVSGRSVSGN